MKEQVWDVKNQVPVKLPDYWEKLTEREKEAWLVANDYRRGTGPSQ